MLAALAAVLVPLQEPAAAPPVPRVRIECPSEIHDFTLDAKAARAITTETGDGIITAWSLADGKQLWKSQEGGVIRVMLCAGDKELLCGFGFHGVAEYDAKTGEKRSSIGGPLTNAPVRAFAGDAKGRWAWFGSSQGLMRLTPGNLEGWSRRALEGGGVRALALDEDGEWLAAGCEDGAVRFANSSSASVDEEKIIAGTGSPVCALAFASKTLVTAADDGSVRVWTLANGKEKHVLASSGAKVRALAVHAKSGRVAAGDERGGLVLWSLETGAELGRWNVESGTAIADVEFAPKGAELFLAAGKRLLSLDLAGS